MSRSAPGAFHTAGMTAAMSDRPLEPAAQQALWRYAEKSSMADLKAALARRHDLDPSLAAKCQKDKSSQVRIAYLSNPSTDMGTVARLLEAETRADVLAGVCSQRPSADVSEVSAMLLARMQGKPTKTLAQALVPVPGLPPMLYAHALAVLVPSLGVSQLEGHLRDRMEIVASDRAASLWLADALPPQAATAGTGWWFWLVPLAESAVLGDQDMQRLIAKFVPSAVSGLAGEVPGSRSHSRPRGARLLDSLASALLSRPSPAVSAVSLLRQEMASSMEWLSPSVAELLGSYDLDTITRRRTERDDFLESCSTCNDPQEILSLVAAHRSDLDALLALAGNPALDEVHLLPLGAAFARSSAYSEALSLAKRSQDPRRYLVYLYATTSIPAVDEWACFAGDPLARRDTVIAARSHPEGSSGTVHDRGLRLVADADPADPCWLEVPWTSVETILSGWQRLSPTAEHMVHALLDKQLELAGANPSSWETLSVLSEGFQGTVLELAQAAASV